MSEPVDVPAYPPPPGPVPAAAALTAAPPHTQPRPSFRDRWLPAAEVRVGGLVVAVLAVVGALLGVVWQWWSPPGPLGYVVAAGAVQPDETEAFIASDGRYAALVAGVGLIAALVVWRLKAVRGPVVVAALCVGGLAGALLTAAVGHWLAGGTADGPKGTILHELPLSVHIHGLLLLEAGVAVLGYTLLTSFAAADDLGRPDPYGPRPDLLPPDALRPALPPPSH